MPSLQALNYTQSNLLCANKLKDINQIWLFYADDNNDIFPRLWDESTGEEVVDQFQRKPFVISTNRFWPVYGNNRHQYINPYIEGYISDDGTLPPYDPSDRNYSTPSNHFKAFTMAKCPLATPMASYYENGMEAATGGLRTYNGSPYPMPYAIHGGAITVGGRDGPLRIGDTWTQTVALARGETEVEVQIFANDHVQWPRSARRYYTSHYAKPGTEVLETTGIEAGFQGWEGFEGAEHTANYLMNDGSVIFYSFETNDITGYRASIFNNDQSFFISAWGDAILPYEALVGENPHLAP